MNGKVAKMLRKTRQTLPREKQHKAKKLWNSFSVEVRAEMRRTYNEYKNIATKSGGGQV